MHGPNPGYREGDHWVECPVCHFDYYASEMKQRWDGQWVCPKDYEPRHPGDFVRTVADSETASPPVYSPASYTVDASEQVDERIELMPSSTFNQTDPLG